MTFAEALNDEACSCGLRDGATWFCDSNGNEPVVVGEYRLLRNNNGVRVEHDRIGFVVEGEKNGDLFAARLTAENTWEALD